MRIWTLLTIAFASGSWWLNRRTRELIDWTLNDYATVVTQLATCTHDRDRARGEVEALRTVLLTLGVEVTLTWTADRVVEAQITRRLPSAASAAGRAWMN